MKRTLDNNCKWDLTWNGQKVDLGEGLDEHLDLFLLKNMDRHQLVKDGKVVMAYMFSKTALDYANSQIEQIRSDVQNAQIVKTRKRNTQAADESPIEAEEIETYCIIPGSMGITKLLGRLNINGGPLVTPFNKTDWERTKIQNLNDPNFQDKITDPTGNIDLKEFMQQTNVSAEKLIEMEENSWEKLTATGTEVHAVFEAIFKGEEPKKGELPEDIFNSLVNQITNFKKSLESKYPGCKFYPELAIKSKNLAPDILTELGINGLDSINGIIDLLVIDANGKGHLYDYKVSRKSINKPGESLELWWDTTGNKAIAEYKLWASTKKLAAAYQTEFYRQMLKQYGVDVIDTNILPVKLNLEYGNSNNPFEITAIKGVEVSEKSLKNPGKRNNSKCAKTVQQLFIPQTSITPADVTAIAHAYDAFFPKNSIMMKKEDMRTKVEYYKRIDNIVHKLKPGEPHYGEEGKEYKIRFRGYKTTYCKESELDAKLQEFINGQSEVQSTKFLDVARAIVDIKDGSASEDALTSLVGENQKSFVKTTFGHYLQDDWTFDEDEPANSIGLFKFRKGNKCEIIVLSQEALRAQVSDFNQNIKGVDANGNKIKKVWKGTSILGRTKSDKSVDSRKVLKAITGNIEMMKVMTYISLHPELFEKMRIAEIKAVNPWLGIEMEALNSDLINSFNQLVIENPNCGVSKVNPTLFMSDAESLVESAKEWNYGNTAFVRKLEDGGGITNDGYHDEQWIQSKLDLIKKQYGSETDLRNGYKDTPIWNAYVKLNEALNSLRGFRTHIEIDKSDFIESGKFFELNGLLISSPQLSSSANIRELGQVIDEYANEVRKQVYIIGAPIQQCFIEVYNKYGTSAKVFESWFADREKLILKDPDSHEFDGDPVTRKALDTFLKTMAKLRHPEIKTDADLKAAKQYEDYYAIPLLEAAASRQIKNLGIFKAIKNKFKQYWTTTEGLFMGEDPTGGRGMSGYVSKHQELYNKLKYDNMEVRQAILDDHGYGLFETDLEEVMNASLVAFCRSNVSKYYIPIIAGLKMSLEYIDSRGSSSITKNMATIRKRFDDIVKSKFYGESIVPESVQPVLKFINMIKAGFTTLTLSLNVRSFLRESLQGIYTGISRAGVKMYPGINEKSYIEGLTYVIQNAHKNFSGVSMLQQLNAVYGMANQSLNQLARQRRVKWAHINHWSKDTLFLTATSPDFMHRMSLLIAKMKNDGCFEAHSLDENGVLVYDFKKDKRFEHLVKGETSHENYLKEQSLYKAMIDDFNRAGFRKEDGSALNAENLDALPQAYTRTEGQSIKNYADLLYGHYDDESKSLLCDTFVGSIFLQYKTFLTSKLEQWTMHEGKYNIAELKQQFDENGNPLYLKFYEDETGAAHKDVVLESEYNAMSDEDKAKCKLYYDYEGLPMQGMLQESIKVYKSILGLSEEKFSEIWKDPTTRAMFKLQIHDMWIMAFLSFLVNLIFGSAEDVDNPADPAAVYKAVKKMGPIENLAYNVITGSMADSQLPNIINAFTDKPPVLSALKRFANTSMNMITGDCNVTYWLTQNVGALRDFQGMVDTMNNQQ